MDGYRKSFLESLGKKDWSQMLHHLATLHEGSLHAPLQDIPYRWEEVAPQTSLAPFFGHWDTIHIAIDRIAMDPQIAISQIMNHLALQQPDGLIPGYIRMEDNKLVWSHKISSPPLWPYAIQEYIDATGQTECLETCYQALTKQIQWFENNRKSGEGFYYLDCLDHFWESGVEEGIRYDLTDTEQDTYVCVDATSHLFALYSFADQWSRELKKPLTEWTKEADRLRLLIQHLLFDPETGFFHDLWSVNLPEKRHLAFEGMWPLVTGAASPEQAQRVIYENLLEPTRFFTAHPIPAVAVGDPLFEYRHWRGPTRNSMTYWAAKGCLHYGHTQAALKLLERALDATTEQFKRTDNLWEFYHPQGGDPRTLDRYEGFNFQGPFTHYLGHNPLIAMSVLWEKCRQRTGAISFPEA